jgi:hypothetical protein
VEWGLSVPALHRLVDLSMGFSFLDRIAFFVFSFPFGEAHFDLDTTVLEIYLEWYQGVTFLGHLPLKSHDFLPVHEELAGTQGFVIHDVAVTVWADVAV